MKKRYLLLTMALIICTGIFISCPGGEEKASEKGAIEKMTEKAGQDLADKLSSPIDEARKVAEQGSDRTKEMMDQMGQ